ncbi:MAG TPA: LysR family transcriptional regulator [Stellaceae bacterium]|nr:LysR family transcriptional regulator [Stellaceae bacterium]
MQGLNWNDLRYLLAVARGGSLGAAAKRLKVDQTTVARRLGAVEAALGTRLFERGARGRLHPTPAARTAIARAERVEREIEALRGIAGGDQALRGTVRITAVPVLVNHVLIPAATALTATHPDLRLELLAEPRNLSLARREADIALRLARPDAGAGDAVLARRIGSLAYGIYAPAGAAPEGDAALPWITYEEGMAGLPQSRWMSAMIADAGGAAAPVSVSDAESVLQAIRSGLGKSLLPAVIGDSAAGLRAVADPAQPFVLTREIWLLTRPEQRRLARIAAAIGWIERTIERLDQLP